LQSSTGGLVRDGGYLSFDNFAAVKADPDARAYVVIHILSILALYPSQARPGMTLTVIAARLRKIAADIEALPPVARERDIPDEMVPKLAVWSSKGFRRRMREGG
jgi:hypothetical protein